MAYPLRCPVCDDILVPKGLKICDKCRKTLEVIDKAYCFKCGKPLFEEGKSLCQGCIEKNHSFNECRSAFVYNDAMRKSIYRFKYHGRMEYSKYYSEMIVNLLGRKIAEYNADAIVPVPMYKKKQRKRGFNQAYLLAKEISHLTNIPVLNNYVIRNKSTKIMRSLGAKERENNLKKAFKISGDVVKLTNVIIVDDIYTTGATMDAMARCLKESGIRKVYGLCLSSGRTGD